MEQTQSQTKSKDLREITFSKDELALTSMLFIRMSSIYGHLWSSQFRSDDMLELAKRDWCLYLRQYSKEEVNSAINICVKNYTKSPTLPEFLICAATAKEEIKSRLPLLKDKSVEKMKTDQKGYKKFKEFLNKFVKETKNRDSNHGRGKNGG